MSPRFNPNMSGISAPPAATMSPRADTLPSHPQAECPSGTRKRANLALRAAANHAGQIGRHLLRPFFGGLRRWTLVDRRLRVVLRVVGTHRACQLLRLSAVAACLKQDVLTLLLAGAA